MGNLELWYLIGIGIIMIGGFIFVLFRLMSNLKRIDIILNKWFDEGEYKRVAHNYKKMMEVHSSNWFGLKKIREENFK